MWWRTHIHPRDRERVEQNLTILLDKGILQHEYRIQKRDGTYIWIYDKLTLIQDGDKSTTKIIGTWTDISRQKAIEERLRESEERFKTIFYTNPDSVCINRLEDGLYIEVNQGFCDITGYTREEVIGKTSIELNIWANPSDRERLISALKHDGCIRNMEARFRLKDETEITGLISANLITIQGKPHILSVARNIDEIKRTHETLKKREKMLNDAQRIAHVGCWEFDIKGNRLTWSDEIYQIFEIPKERFEATYEAFLNTVHPQDREFVDKSYTDSVKYRRPYNIEHRLVMPDGRIKWVQEQCETFYDDEGDPVRSLGTVLDITEKKQAYFALEKSEERFRHLFENSPVPLWEEDFTDLMIYLKDLVSSGMTVDDLSDYLKSHPDVLEECARRVKILDVNKAALDLHEANTKEELLEGLTNIFTKKSYEVFKKEIIALAKGIEQFESEAEIRTLRGNFKDIMLRLVWKKTKDQDSLSRYLALVATTDITPLKKAERELERRLRELQFLYDISASINSSLTIEDIANGALEVIRKATNPDVGLLFLIDQQGYFNLACSHISNSDYTLCTRLIHYLKKAFCKMKNQPCEPIFLKNLKEFLDCPKADCEEIRLKSTAVLPLIHTRTLLGFIVIGSFDQQDFKKEQKFLMTLSNETAIGIKNALLIKELRDHEAELEAIVKQRTKKLLEVNKELESFTYSVSHDLRAPIRAIDGFSNILQEEYGLKLDDEAKRLIGIIRKNTRRMGQLIDDLLRFSRLSRKEMNITDIDMEALAKSVFYEITSGPDRERIHFVVRKMPPAQGDPSLIRQVLYNLISNAIKFSIKRYVPKIELGSKTLDSGEIIYYIKDNGVGFDTRYAHKLFKIFERLHPIEEFEGTGIGLSIAKRIINRHGGRIWAESQKDRGTVFYFTLSIHE